ncbi:hypothetical protein F25303_12625 [Fusarium sp. NRRL 25303]|nr:hypothetical protein F25303_12625 [Fusarium sp. NRRL 25303]
MKELEPGMARDQRELQSQTLRILQSKLEAATMAISKPEKHASSKRTKAIQFLGLRETLESTVAELESWQKRFEPTWFQMIKSGPPDLDRALRKASQNELQDRAEPVREGLKLRQAFDPSGSVKLSEKVLQDLEWKTIPFCKAKLAIRREERSFIIENVFQETVGWRDARELASRLRDSNPFTFGMLKCKGVVQSPTGSPLKFVFGVQEGYSKVQSCRQLLLSRTIPDSLTTRLQIARQLVTAVYYVHLYEFVHKNITPETVLILEQPETRADLVVCLVGFQLFRLGVCLLEIGLWNSLVDYDDGGAAHTSSILQAIGGSSEHLRPEAIKEKLLSLTHQGNTAFGNPEDFEGDDGDGIGSRYIRKIMDTISIIQV